MVSFTAHGLPLLAVIALWFGSTALILWLDSRPTSSFGRSLAWSGAAAIGGAILLAFTLGDTGSHAAYLSFVGALAIWGWHELSFLTGVVAGPNRAPCPPRLTGWPRFRAAAATLIHHELALAATAILLLALSWGRANPTGAIAFALLFLLRLSTKLNIFLGVPAFAAELLPPRLAYLRSYFTCAPMTAFFPLSLLAACGAAAWFATGALAAHGGEAVAASLLFALAALGIVEHLFLVLPLRDAALWRWARSAAAADGVTTAPVRHHD